MRSLAFFNNKGGVGKTTLASNMAAFASISLGKRVLMVDMDPQCNTTQLMLHEDQWQGIYTDRRVSANNTVLKALSNIRAGDSTVDTRVVFHESERFRCNILAGHPSLSTVEDRLSASWVEFLGGDLGGARRSNWVRSLAETLDYDLVIFDCGPSLGALNRCALIGSDAFITPMAADLFSLYALDNIGEWMSRWVQEYERGHVATQENAEQDVEDDFGILQSLPVTKGYIGYTVQQYVTRNAAGLSRAVYAYDRYKEDIPSRAEALARYGGRAVDDINLGLVPNMFSMVPLAQAQHAPIQSLTTQDGVRGAQVSQQRRYAEQLAEIGDRLFANLETIAED